MPQSKSPVEGTIEARTHGRYLVVQGDRPDAPLLVGFHGYGENAEDHLNRLRVIPGVEGWTVLSVEGLHVFYRRSNNTIVASWMTRQNRELAIADNVEYVTNVVRRVASSPVVVMTGFSQGASMAYRAAAAMSVPVIACGGDVPPDLDAAALARIPAALIGQGKLDPFYTSAKLIADQEQLKGAGVPLETAVLDAAHEWTPEFSEICSVFLRRLSTPAE
jgi:predicted esterase